MATSHWKEDHPSRTQSRFLYRCIILTIVLVLMPGVGISASELIPNFVARYIVQWGIARGDIKLSLNAGEGDVHIYESRSRTKGLIGLFKRGEIRESTVFKLTPEGLRPLHYTLSDTISKNRDAELVFDWDTLQVESAYKDRTNTLPLKTGMVDRLLLQIVIMENLKEGKRPSAYTIVDRGKIKTFQIHWSGEEEVDVHFGRFRTIKVEHMSENSEKVTVLWCAEDLHFLPVQIEFRDKDKRPVRAELVNLSGLI